MELFTTKPLLTKTKKWFRRTQYIVDYKSQPGALKRIIIIDEVPGKVFTFLKFKTKRRIFVGPIKWEELIKGKKISCPKPLSRHLSDIDESLYKRYRLKVKADRKRWR